MRESPERPVRPVPPPTTAHGALINHISGGHIETTDGQKSSFQPMNVNFGLFPPLTEAIKSPDGKRMRGPDKAAAKKKALTALHARQLRNLKNTEVSALLDRVWGKTSESSVELKATVARLKRTYNEAPVWSYDVAAGKKVFEKTCVACHALDSTSGSKLGPNLAGTWRNGLDYFLENIIDPNAVVGDNFQLHVLTKKDGSVISGVIEQETDTAITARTVTESVIISKAELQNRQKMPVSLMPPGLLESMPERKALELLKYLLSKRE